MVVNRKAERRRLVAEMARQGRGVDEMAAEVARRERCGADLLYGPKLPGAALALADEAVKIAQRVPCTGLAEARTLRAVSLARQGNPAARGAIDDLAHIVERLPADVLAESTSWANFGERRLRCAEATACMWLRETARARRAAEQAIALHPHGLEGSVAQLEISVVATCMVLDGEVVNELEHATQTLKRLPDAALSVKNMGDVVLAAAPEKARALPAAAELRELTHV